MAKGGGVYESDFNDNVKDSALVSEHKRRIWGKLIFYLL